MTDQPPALSSLPRCSEREIQIISLLGRGLGTEIANDLELSVRTVKVLRASTTSSDSPA